jgi:hypothetical protein
MRFGRLGEFPGAAWTVLQQVGHAELRNEMKGAREVVADRHVIKNQLRRQRGP